MLRVDVLGMLERHVQEPALVGAKLAVEAAVHGILRRGERALVAGERARRVAKDVAGELVQQQDARERAVRSRAPLAVAAGERDGDGFTEAASDLLVEARILAKPDVARLAAFRRPRRTEPEIDDGGSDRVHTL